MNEEIQKNNKLSEAGSKLMKGTSILVIAGIIGKFLGAAFRIPLTHMIGAKGQSYYGAAYAIYNYLYVFATAGFPVAISRMVSKRIALNDYRNAHKSYKVALKLMIVIGAISFAICFFGAGAIANAMKNPDAKLSIMTLSPALLLAPIVASFRGYFQGQQNMFPTGISEIGEQFVRVIVGLSLTVLLLKFGEIYATAGATFGAPAGLIASLIILLFIFSKVKKQIKKKIEDSNRKEESSKSLLGELVNIAIPITIGSTIMPFMFILDAAIVMRRLQATGWSYSMSKTLYGLISGYVDPLTGFPGLFIDAIAISLLPAVTEAITLNKIDELNKNIKTGIKTMMVIAFPCAIGLIVLAKPILRMLYFSRIDEADMAVSLLQIQAISIITLSTMRIFSSALQGLGKMYLPLKNLFIGMVVKIATTYILVGIHFINVNGAAIGSVLAFLVASILNYRDIKKYADVKLNLKDVFTKPLFASVVMGIIAILLYKLIFLITSSNAFSTLFAILAAVLVYFVAIFKLKVVGKEEAMLIPKGDYIVKLAEKLKLL